MGLFDTTLRDDQTLFRNEEALDFDFIPKLLPYREQQQRAVATLIQPLLTGRNGRNLLVFGPPGVGKTAAIRWVLNDLEETSDDVYIIYINCWQKNTTFQIVAEICDQLGYKFTQNKRTDELFTVIKNIVNKKAVVFAFDEIDKVTEYDFLYTLLEEVLKKTIILITNFKEWADEMDIRIKSRLVPTLMPFEHYNPEETFGILKQRRESAFVPGVWDEIAFKLIADKAAQLKDIRTGLFMMREAGLHAESKSQRKITEECARAAIEKVSLLEVKKSEELEEETKDILKLIKTHSNQKIGDLFKKFQDAGGKASYKTFQRKVEKLVEGGFIHAQKMIGGAEGTTTILTSKSDAKLSDFSEKK